MIFNATAMGFTGGLLFAGLTTGHGWLPGLFLGFGMTFLGFAIRYYASTVNGDA